MEKEAQLRHNVDVWLDSEAQIPRWLEDSPSTYRIGVGSPPSDDAIVLATVDLRPGSEPLVAPVAVTLPDQLVEDLADDLQILQDPVAAYSVLRQSGHRYSLVPSPGGLSVRKDPIRGSGSLVIMAAVPIHDVGGGSRGRPDRSGGSQPQHACDVPVPLRRSRNGGPGAPVHASPSRGDAGR